MNQFIKLTPTTDRDHDRGRRLDAILIRTASITHVMEYERLVEVHWASFKTHWWELVRERMADFENQLQGFIKLTPDVGNYGPSTLLAKANCITHVERLKAARNPLSIVYLSADTNYSYKVTETPETIYQLIKEQGEL